MCSRPHPDLVGVVTVIYRESWIDEARDETAVLELACQVVTAEPNLAAIAFPAGTLVVGPDDNPDAGADRFLAELPPRRPAIVFGVDVCDLEVPLEKRARKGQGARLGWDDNKDPTLPYFGYVAMPDGKQPVWGTRQLAYRSKQVVSHARLPSDRTFRLGAAEFGLLMCGEMMANVYGRGRPFDRVRHLVDRADIVVDIAHANIAVRSLVRWTTAVKDVASSGRGARPVFIAQHLSVDYIRRALPKYTDNGVAPRLASAASRHVRRTDVGEIEPGIPAAHIDVYQVG